MAADRVGAAGPCRPCVAGHLSPGEHTDRVTQLPTGGLRACAAPPAATSTLLAVSSRRGQTLLPGARGA